WCGCFGRSPERRRALSARPPACRRSSSPNTSWTSSSPAPSTWNAWRAEPASRSPPENGSSTAPMRCASPGCACRRPDARRAATLLHEHRNEHRDRDSQGEDAPHDDAEDRTAPATELGILLDLAECQDAGDDGEGGEDAEHGEDSEIAGRDGPAGASHGQDPPQGRIV